MKICKFAPLGAIGILLACTAEPEVAQTETPTPVATDTAVTDPLGAPAAITRWDANGDVRFERAEYTAYGPANFNNYDKSRDNRIDLPELVEGWTKTGWSNGEQAFELFDANRDSYLDNAEFFSDASFTPLDGNGDGALSADEWRY